MEKEHLRDLLTIQDTVKGRIKFLDTAGFDKEEISYRKQECGILLKKVSKIRTHRQKPIQELSTVRGTTFKIGDKFHIAGDELSQYTIVLFPDTVTIRGESSNPAIGKPWTCEVYLENAHKIKKVKPAKKGKKQKKVRIEAGEYFATRTNNTIYKAITTTNKTVEGFNKLTAKNAPKKIKANLRDICIKTKKEYKKQLKAEKKFKG